METIKINVNSARETDKLQKAAKVLKAGGVVVYPTETVYGLGASIASEKGVKRVHKIKKEPDAKPLTIALAKTSQIKSYAVATPQQMGFIEGELPGPVTLILPKIEPEWSRAGVLKKGVPDWVSRETVGIRIPACRAICRLIELAGPITSTSANVTGHDAPWSYKQVRVRADLGLDGGMCRTKKASRIIDMTTGEILRR